MRSLTTKLTLAFLLIGLTGSILVAVILRQQTRRAFDQFILNREQQALVNNLVFYYKEKGSWEGVGAGIQAIFAGAPQIENAPRDLRREWLHFTLVGADRKVIYSPLPAQIGEQISNRDLNRAIPLTVDNQTTGWLMLTPMQQEWIPDSPEGAFLRNINRATLISALFAASLALILGGVLAYTLTSSLRELTEATVEIARGKFGMQVKVRSQDELGELATSFNRMSRDLARATEARRRMTADIAHELRSPLSVISGYAEALSDEKLPGTPEIYGILHQETRHLSRLVDDLRTLSLAEAGELQLNLTAVAPKSLLEWVASRHNLLVQQKNISMRVQVQPDLPTIQVDMERMAQVLDNLILNAFRYAPEGGEITLEARGGDGKVELIVRDNGSGISAEDLPHVFDRFYRADKSRQLNGESGLGLAIAKSFVEAHSGTITAESTQAGNAPGSGATTFTIRI